MSRLPRGGTPRLAERAALVADAIESMLFYYPFPEPFAHTVFDLLRLLELRPGWLTLWDHQRKAPAWTTLSTQERGFRGFAMPWMGGESPLPAGYRLNERLEILLYCGNKNLTPAVARVFAVFQRHETIGQIVDLLDKFAEQRKNEHPIGWPPSVPGPFTPEPSQWAERMRGPLSRIMSRVAAWDSVMSLARLTKDDTYRADTSDAEAPLNLFAVTTWRLPQGSLRTAVNPESGVEVHYPYTGRILLTEAQRAWIRELPAATWDGEVDPVKAIETEIGLRSRFLSDSALDSGSLEVGLDVHAARNTSTALDLAADAEDVTRHRVESSLYRLLGPKPKRVFLSIPVHVGGGPWLALYTLVDPDAWLEVFHLYRQIIPVLAQRLRREARETYLSCLVESLRTELRNSRTWNRAVLARINASWTTAGLAFPFPVPGIEEAQDDDQGANLFSVGGVNYRIIEQYPEGFFRSTVKFGAIGATELAARCRESIGSIHVDRIVKLDGVLTFGHELKNVLDETQFDSIRRELLKPRDRWNPELLATAVRGLGHLYWARGLVALLSDFAKATVPSERTRAKAAIWERSTAGFVWSAEILGEYRTSLTELAEYLASFYPCPSDGVGVRLLDNTDGIEELTLSTAWDQAVPANLRSAGNPLDMLWFPPVPEGAEWNNLRLAIATLLAEPLRNAFKAMQSNGPTFRHPLVVYSLKASGDGVEIEVVNTIPDPDGVTGGRNSLELVNGLGKALRIGTVSDLARSTLADGTPVMTTTITLHPQHYDLSKDL